MTSKRKRTGRRRKSRSVEGVPTINVDTVLDWIGDDSTEVEYHYPTVELGDFLARAEFDLLKRLKPHISELLKPRKVEKKIPSAVTEQYRLQLAIFLYDCVVRLCGLALDKQDTRAKEWAGKTLGSFVGWPKNRDANLTNGNRWYGQAKSEAAKFKELKLPSLIRQIVVKEMEPALHYWFVLQVNPNADVPEEYKPLGELKSYPEVEEKWFKEWLWPRIKKRKDEILPELKRCAPMRVRHLKDCYGQFRDVSQSLSRSMLRRPLRVAGTQ
jgi:hypothetical protein